MIPFQSRRISSNSTSRCHSCGSVSRYLPCRGGGWRLPDFTVGSLNQALEWAGGEAFRQPDICGRFICAATPVQGNASSTQTRLTSGPSAVQLCISEIFSRRSSIFHCAGQWFSLCSAFRWNSHWVLCELSYLPFLHSISLLHTLDGSGENALVSSCLQLPRCIVRWAVTSKGPQLCLGLAVSRASSHLSGAGGWPIYMKG